jgi:hypothetical protein
MARTAARVLAIALTLAGGNDRLRAATEAPPMCAAGDTVPSQIRPMGCQTAMAMANGMVRLATLRRMGDRVGELNGIVYIEDRYYLNDGTRRVLSGALSHHITVAGAYRVLHLLVAPEAGNRTGIGEEWMANSRAPSLDDAGRVLAIGSRNPINGRDEAHDDDLYVYRLPAPAAHRVPLTIMLHVDDYAAVPRKLLLRAEARAHTVYTLAGVETLWANRSMPQEQHSEGSALAEPVSSHAVHLRLIILSDEMTQRKLRDSRHGSDVIGLAQAAPELSNTVAFVFFARLERAADRHVESTSDVLGHVMAHELGHLILEHGSHSDTGIMRDTWESNERRTPVFTVEQAAMIRTRLLAAGASEIK